MANMKRPPIKDSFGARVRALRLLRGLTQVQLAEKVEISQPALSDIELNESSPYFIRGETLAKLCEVLETNRKYLHTGNESPVQAKVLSIEETEMVDIYRHLSPLLQSALLSHCRSMLEIEKGTKPSRARPYLAIAHKAKL